MILSSILLCLVVGEGVLWVFFPIPEEQPYQKIMLQDIPGLKPNILYERNAQGLRSLSMTTWKKPPKTFRILCLGASTTDQTNQGTPDTWSGILESELKEIGVSQGVQIQVAAYGRGGTKAKDNYIWAVNNLAELEPDLVIYPSRD